MGVFTPRFVVISIGIQVAMGSIFYFVFDFIPYGNIAVTALFGVLGTIQWRIRHGHRKAEESMASNQDFTAQLRAVARANQHPSVYPIPGYSPGGQVPSGYSLGQAAVNWSPIDDVVRREMMRQLQRLTEAEPTPDLGEPEDAEGEFKGWRMFSIALDEHGYARLKGVRDHQWEGRELTAQCADNDAEPHLTTGQCRCGIYLMKSLPAEEAVTSFTNQMVVVAECSGWGYAVEHDHGWRVQHCRIDRLFMLTANKYLVQQMEDRYGVPVLSSRLHASALLGEWSLPEAR